MDQITVSDIPLPGEEFGFKTDNQVSDDAPSKAELPDITTPIEDVTIEQQTECTSVNHTQNTVKTTESVENIPEPEVQEIEQEVPVSDNHTTETIVTDNEAHKLASEILMELAEVETVECVTIAETVEELQMEVERVVSDETCTSTEVERVASDETCATTPTVQEEEHKIQEEQVVEAMDVDESMEKLQLNETKDDHVEVDETVETIVSQEVKIEVNPIVEQPVEELITEETIGEEQISEEPPIVEEPVVEEPLIEESPAVIEEVITIPDEKVEANKPAAKKTTRTNSTIEAIKNDWADTLTIEEIEEDINESSPKPETKPQREPIVTEPDKKEEKTPETLEIIEETTEVDAKTSDGVTQVIVLDSVNEEIVATMSENVTIEIIDDTIDTHTVVMKDAQQQETEPSVAQDNQTAEQVKNNEQEIKETVYIIEEVANNNREPEIEKEKKPRGRPSKLKQSSQDDKLQIPCHVLGRNVDNPTEDLISNGRTPPKPRLGVKVPYRFLTSQIVSKEEIADELIELTNKRNPAPDPPAGGDIFFASKLTQRLASKLANKKIKTPVNTSSSTTTTTTIPDKTNDKHSEATSGIPSDALTNSTSHSPLSTPSGSNATKQNTITDNSDLLAILEGDVDVDLTKEVHNTKKTDEVPEVVETKVVKTEVTSSRRVRRTSPPSGGVRKLDPETEKQIALKQLREMPKKQETRGRPRKNQPIYSPKPQYAVIEPKLLPVKKELGTKTVKLEVETPTVKPAISLDASPDIKQAVTKLAKKIKENENILTKNDKNKIDNTLEIENDLNLTPKRVTKTYSRKEAVLNVPDELEYIVNEPETPSALSEPPAVDKEASETPAAEKPNNKQQKVKEEERKTKEEESRETKQKNVEETKTQSRKHKRPVADLNKPEVTLVSKRARVIKKKVIWDPAEVPKTKVLNAIRKAQALEMKKRKQQQKSEESEDETTEEEDEEEKESTKEEPTKEEPKQKPKQRPLRRNKILPRQPLTKVQQKILMKRQLRSFPGRFRSSNGELKSSLALTKKKKQVMAVIAKSVKPKKTELDRLLGDEGAVNMLYSVKQDKIRGNASQKSAITKKDLLNRKKVIRDVITQISGEETTKALRKKESPTLPAIQIPPRKKSRDSVRSSLQSPPPSPSYFPPHRAEASRIIRRHSSSFSSDCSSPRRLSIDQPQQNDKAADENKNKENNDFQSPVRVLRRKGAHQDRKSEEKQVKNKKDEPKTEKGNLSVAEKRKLNIEMSKNFDKIPKKRTRSSRGEDDDVKEEVKIEVKAKSSKKSDKDETEIDKDVQTDYKEILLKQTNNVYQIVMSSPANAKLKDVISIQMFQELSSVLTKLSTDATCKVVTLSSASKSFCRGLDFSNLVQTTAEKRSAAAHGTAKALKDFILTIAKFPKPLIASLHSSASLLGCTMLPYFDLVVCSDTATLSADYSRLGHGPEGAAALGLGAVVGPTLATEMLMLGRGLTAKEALEKGLVTRVEKPEKLKEVVRNLGGEISEKSLQSLTATKSLLRQALLQKLEEALEIEQKILIEHWTSTECQQSFKKLLQEEQPW